MKQVFPDVAEKNRLKTGRYGTKRGDRKGRFEIYHNGKVLRCMIAAEEYGWDHVSVSTNGKHPPTWNDMCYVKDVFFEDEETVIQFHPKKSLYVNIHGTCLHMWRPTDKEVDLPPLICV